VSSGPSPAPFPVKILSQIATGQSPLVNRADQRSQVISLAGGRNTASFSSTFNPSVAPHAGGFFRGLPCYMPHKKARSMGIKGARPGHAFARRQTDQDGQGIDKAATVVCFA
jgi:hypothetical protein